jgi:hypothetical protein
MGFVAGLHFFTLLFSSYFFIIQKKYRIVQSRLLNEIDSGSCTGMTYKQVSQKMPEEVPFACFCFVQFSFFHLGC